MSLFGFNPNNMFSFGKNDNIFQNIGNSLFQTKEKEKDSDFSKNGNSIFKNTLFFEKGNEPKKTLFGNDENEQNHAPSLFGNLNNNSKSLLNDPKINNHFIFNDNNNNLFGMNNKKNNNDNTVISNTFLDSSKKGNNKKVENQLFSSENIKKKEVKENTNMIKENGNLKEIKSNEMNSNSQNNNSTNKLNNVTNEINTTEKQNEEDEEEENEIIFSILNNEYNYKKETEKETEKESEKEKKKEKKTEKEKETINEEDEFNNLIVTINNRLIEDDYYYNLISEDLKNFKKEIDNEMEKHEELYKKIIPREKEFSINLKRINKFSNLMNNIQPDLEKSFFQIENLVNEQKGIIKILDNLEAQLDKNIAHFNKKEKKKEIEDKIINNRNEIEECINKINQKIENEKYDDLKDVRCKNQENSNINNEVKNIFNSLKSINVEGIKSCQKIFIKKKEKYMNLN